MEKEKKFNHVSLRLDDLRYSQLKEICHQMGLSYNAMLKMLISQTYASMKKSEEMVQSALQEYIKNAMVEVEKSGIKIESKNI